ncbi:MAG: FAD-dependent oxidoreductase [Nanoarchaeota archaeon]|nr:FAD-dependent oxidoreductase [Nanoarchaeota archaeon]
MKYDLIIVGGGPAGLTAGIYAARYRLNTLIISKNIGGLASTAPKICNYPSQMNIKGFELMQNITKQVQELGVEIIYDEIKKIEKKNDGFIVHLEKKKYNTKKIIYAAGTDRLRMNIPGEGKFLGRGISYCATCDAAFFKKKTVAVIGGADAALSSALLLSEFASKVYIIYRQDYFFRAEPAWIELVQKQKKITLIFNEEVLEINGKDKVESIKLKSGKELNVNGIFVEIGSVPQTKILEGLGIKTTEKGYIIVDRCQKTNVKGLFAAGDVTNNRLKQIITAAGEGACAAFSAYEELKKNK